MLVSLLISLALIAATLGVMSLASRRSPALGLHHGRLLACPTKPNCLCSEYPGDNTIEPLHIPREKPDIADYIPIVRDMGGKIVSIKGRYLHATFTTRLIRFIDDFELRIDTDQNLLHVRSASRIGHSDFGKNRQRIKEFKHRLEQSILKH